MQPERKATSMLKKECALRRKLCIKDEDTCKSKLCAKRVHRRNCASREAPSVH